MAKAAEATEAANRYMNVERKVAGLKDILHITHTCFSSLQHVVHVCHM